MDNSLDMISDKITNGEYKKFFGSIIKISDG